MVSDDIKKIAFEFGLTDDYIQKKVNQTLKIAEEKGMDFSKPALIGYDMNHPLTPTWESLLYPHVNVQRGILAIHGARTYPTIISGWDLSSLRYFRDRRLGISNMGLIGELGAAYDSDGRIYEVLPAEDERYYEMIREIFVKSAEAGYKISKQGNLSKRVACIYFEAEGESRGNLKNHFFTREKDVTTADIYTSISAKEHFSFDGKKIGFEPTPESLKELDRVLTYVHTLQSVRLEKKGNTIYAWRDKEDRKEFSLDEMSNFVKNALPKGWEADANNDFCMDIKYTGDGVKVDKEVTANVLAKTKFGAGDYIITNIGDKKGDVLFGKNTIFFPCYGTKAEEYCQQNSIPHVPVINGADYSLIIAEIVNSRQKAATPRFEVVKINKL